MNPNLIIISHPTYVGASGATAAATYSFFTREYRPPSQERSIQYDVVHNQNGKFKYVYDNGPGFRVWSPFSLALEDAFTSILGATAGMQYDRIRQLWEYPGVLGLRTPEGAYNVHWAENNREDSFRAFPAQVNDKLEWTVVVQFEEAT